MLKRLGIRYRRPNKMSHTYATQMLMAGINHSWCAQRLGHSLEMLKRTCTKWIDRQQDDAEIARLELPREVLVNLEDFHCSVDGNTDHRAALACPVAVHIA